MSGGTKQQFKQFKIDNVQDACVVLGRLIAGVVINLEKYKEYSLEATALLENTNEEYINAKQYDDISDKLLYRQHQILKLTADHQSSSFSYIDLRKMMEKKGFLKSVLPQEILIILNELLDVRNCTFHNQQSMLVAAKEAAEKNIPDELKKFAKITPQINPVIISKVCKYELVMFASLVDHTEKRIEQFEKILSSMKADYQEMYDSIEEKAYIMTENGFSSDVQYIEIYRTSGLSDYNSDIAQISMAIQKSKYDGSDENYREWVVRFNEDNTTSN
ncbi:MAG: hypothetical protein IJ366_04770 [Clostridia bacterium]|nr:hypothetical protein [Clostridia bacterium]